MPRRQRTDSDMSSDDASSNEDADAGVLKALEAGSESGSSSGDSDGGDAAGPASLGAKLSLANRLKDVFKKDKKAAPSSEPVADLVERVDAKLLEEVKEYEATPTDAAAYGSAAFWDERYASSEEVFEWYHPWENLAPSLTQYMAPSDRLLICGCGNSDLGPEMTQWGFGQLTSADISRVVIDQMTDKYPALNWVAVDLTFTAFADAEFDVAVDKGCLDSIVCHMDGQARARRYLQEMDRVTADEGAFICVSSGTPDVRLNLLEDFDAEERSENMLAWDVHVDAIAKPTVKARQCPDLTDPSEMYFIYVCLKDPQKAARKNAVRTRAERERVAGAAAAAARQKAMRQGQR